MINYANRGSYLEQLVQYANAQYQNKGIARIDKFPTPIDPEKVVGGKVYGHYAQKSTVDYIGAIKKGAFICFDCKETADRKKFPLSNIHRHQMEYMGDVIRMGGIAFLIICFTSLDKCFRMDYEELLTYWQVYERTQERSKRAPGTASIPLEAFTIEVASESGICLHYLRGLVD